MSYVVQTDSDTPKGTVPLSLSQWHVSGMCATGTGSDVPLTGTVAGTASLQVPLALHCQ